MEGGGQARLAEGLAFVELMDAFSGYHSWGQLYRQTKRNTTCFSLFCSGSSILRYMFK